MNLKKYFITLGILLASLTVILSITLIIFYSMMGGKFSWNDMGQLLFNQELPGKTSVLIIGTDKDGTRADVMIVAILDPKLKKIDMISIPRDIRITVGGKYYKINSSLALGKEKMAISESKKLLGIDIQHYINVNFQGFRNVIDILGGVYFDVPRNMFYEDPEQDLFINLKKGYQLLDGKKSEQLVRFRSYLEGDVDRIRMQQAFLQETFKQKLNASMIAKAPALVSDISKNVKTDIATSDYPKYISLLSKLTKDDLKLHETPGEGKYIGNISYFIPDTSKLTKMMDEIKNPPTPTATPLPTNN